MKYFIGFNSLRLLWRIRGRKELRCRGQIMVESYVEMNSKNYVRSVV
jgi:hypothetical protein